MDPVAADIADGDAQALFGIAAVAAINLIAWAGVRVSGKAQG